MYEKRGKQKLIEQLQAYMPYDELEEKHRDRILQFLAEYDNNFRRSNLHGHITGSALLLNKDKTKVLLNHHRKLNMWMQFGGHADGDADILGVAIREAQEESGIEDIIPVDDSIFDLDVHAIPQAKNGEPEHFHYDIRYFLCTPEANYSVSKESISMKWVGLREASEILKGKSFVRMIEKWQIIAGV